MTLKTKTEHPHIVRVKGIRSGRPVIKDTGIEVALIVKLHKMGESVDEILSLYPNLAPAPVYDALSYYHNHQKEIEHLIADQDIQVILEQNDLTIDSQGHILPSSK
ncbi:MAG: DUF433 domain-containing protein [Dehalococcoidia bacterium]|nr:DUF433 domain-containing protein [Dehalococcoidia bacterium]